MENNKTNNNNVSVPLAIVLAGAMIAGAVYLGGRTPLTEEGGGLAKATLTEAIPANSSDHILGDINAPVVIIEYSDLECPFCKIFHRTMHDIIDEYDGKVAWVYRHLPFHSKAIKEAEASECAFEQGGNVIFWKYIDEVFERTNGNNSLDLNVLPKIASELGINVDEFNKCLSGGKYTKVIEDGIDIAVDAGITATPYSLIIESDGTQTFIRGAEPIEDVRLKIDKALNSSSN